jgi:hypothetical protein
LIKLLPTTSSFSDYSTQRSTIFHSKGVQKFHGKDNKPV